MCNNGNIITVITGNYVVITGYNECNNDGLIVIMTIILKKSR